MNRCPITYQPCGDYLYSIEGVKLLSPKLTSFQNLPLSAAEQRQEAANRANKLSIQGVQPKLSAVLSIKNQQFEIVDQYGNFIIKPQSDIFPELPENEDLTMRMAKVYGINVPLHGLVYSKDNSKSYFIKRFDRYSKGRKLATEDFAQLTGNSRDTKYNFTMEKMIKVIDDFCTFPSIEKADFFKRALFCFITGNEDMHLKNFSLITRLGKTTLTPAYDFLNSSIAIKSPQEEMALKLKGKKSNFKSSDFIDYFAKERLGLSDKVIDQTLKKMFENVEKWNELIEISFLSEEMKEKYLKLLKERLGRF
ncbi:phosphatidylinositol kinase [Flavobacterium aquidurense]|uniref:HipA domain-containing protein n=1 Tax=Flavobacterium aquidurense TaxID=362413 RepID=UPI0009171D75|nr:HipA domain-containing protein [Flavobacterium aquidurense]OXA67359.1 phosphatidylinositol kinase [Flavobacterium aquidurense]SHH65543.1 serine/threonine-protein kinase HipA [Flavobacterium frigidimaris]